MSFPYRFNIISGALVLFAVLAFMAALGPYPGAESWIACVVFLLFAGVVLVTTGKKPSAPKAQKPPTDRGIFPALLALPLQDSTGMVPMLEDGPAFKLLIGFLIVCALIGGYMLWKKSRKPKSGGK